jgi:transposase
LRSGPRKIFDQQRALELSEAGKSIREIAAALQVGYGTVQRFLLSGGGQKTVRRI